MSPDDLERALDQSLTSQRLQNQFRQRIETHSIDSTHLLIDGRRFTNFASNNYLGLTHHPQILAAVGEALAAGAGSVAAGLISGYSDLHRDAEETIARWKNMQACVLLPSGYQANLAAIQTLAACAEGRGGARFLLDRLVHASLVDAVRAAGAQMRIFPHNQFDKLSRLLAEAPAQQLQIVVTESIFSMDGDTVALGELAAIKKKSPFVLLLDEAHASGVYGPAGAGFAAECGLGGIVDVSIATLSKALGCVGGAVCASKKFCDALVNFGRAYVFSTSIPPMIAAVARAAVGVCCDEPHRQQRVRVLARRVRELTSSGITIGPGDSPIIPLICGQEKAAQGAAETLRETGMFVIAVRPPSVPRGSSRLRVTVSCDHTDAEIDALIDAIKGLNLPRLDQHGR